MVAVLTRNQLCVSTKDYWKLVTDNRETEPMWITDFDARNDLLVSFGQWCICLVKECFGWWKEYSPSHQIWTQIADATDVYGTALLTTKLSSTRSTPLALYEARENDFAIELFRIHFTLYMVGHRVQPFVARGFDMQSVWPKDHEWIRGAHSSPKQSVL